MLTVVYDPVLGVLAFFVAMVPAYGALDLASHVRKGSSRARIWLHSAGAALGFGAWATHFVAALGMRFTVPVAYNLPLVLLALLISVAGGIAAFTTGARPGREGLAARIPAAAILTASITASHYVSESARRMPAIAVREAWVVALGVGILFLAAFLAMWLAFGTTEARGLSRLRRRIYAAALVGAGVAGSHGVSMAGTTFIPLDAGLQPVHGVEDLFFVFAIATGATAVLALVLTATVLETRGDRRQMGYMLGIMSAVALTVGGISTYVAYEAVVQSMRDALQEGVRIQARFIEAVARFDVEHSGDTGNGRAATLAQVADAQRSMSRIGRTGEFLVGVEENDSIAFLGSDRPGIPIRTRYAEPIRRALQGQEGTVIGPDYRGVTVLAAYQHVPALDIGIVAKVDMAEIREPFIRVAFIGGAVTFAVILLGALIFIRFANPLLRRLREGEFMDTILSSAPQAIMLLDRDGMIIKVNDRFASVFGYAPAAVEGSLARDVLVTVENVGRLARLNEAVLRDGYAVDDIPMTRPDGSAFWARLAGSPAAGLGPGSVVFAADDVSAVKRAQQAIAEAEERYRRLVETASDLVWSVDTDGRWTFLNAACEEIYGAPAAELLRTPFMDRIAPEDREEAGSAWATVMAGGEIEGHETTQLDVHGERKTLSFSARPLLDADGGFAGAQGTARDVTERARTLEALNELVRQQELLRSLINNTTDPIFYKGRDRVYRGCNHAFEDFAGLPEAEIIGKTDDDIFPPDRARQYSDQDRVIFESGEPLKAEEWVTFSDGRRVLLDTLKTPFYGPDGEHLGLIGISRDVTDRKRLEDELAAAADEARRASAMKSAFLANMSHEIRTPMNGVLGMIELLLDTELDLDQQQAVGLARTSAESLLQILDDILDFSKIEAGQLSLENIPFDLHATVDAAVRVLAVRAAARENELVMDVRPDVPAWVDGDPGRIRQVLTNLVSNAVKFTDHGEVVVTVQRASESDGTARVRFSVRDTGIGIPADKIDHIFQEFTQADSSTTRHFGGTGLGLAICRKLVSMMGGELSVESQEGVGSEFHFVLPLEVVEGRETRPGVPVEALAGRETRAVPGPWASRRTSSSPSLAPTCSKPWPPS